jgi:lipoate-protein ligase A
VLHHLELTYAVTARLGEVLPGPLQAAYAALCAALVRAARSLGVAAEMTGGEVNLRLPGPRTTVPCFEAPAGGEVVVGGRKLVGSSARARAGCLLQHGAILIGWDPRLQAGAMGLRDDGELRTHVTTFAEQLDRVPSRDEVAEAVVRAFEAELGVDLEEAPLTAAESAAENGLVDRYSIVRVLS